MAASCGRWPKRYIGHIKQDGISDPCELALDFRHSHLPSDHRAGMLAHCQFRRRLLAAVDCSTWFTRSRFCVLLRSLQRRNSLASISSSVYKNAAGTLKASASFFAISARGSCTPRSYWLTRELATSGSRPARTPSDACANGPSDSG